MPSPIPKSRIAADSLYWEHMKLSALLHDLGKLLSLHNEPPTNVDSGNWFLCEPSAGVGFDSPSIIQQFNHDEFGYFKIRSHVPFRVAMIMRFHSSANLHSHARQHEQTTRKIASRAGEYEEAIPFIRAFTQYDLATKRRGNGDAHVTKVDWVAYERLVRRYFPGGEVPW